MGHSPALVPLFVLPLVAVYFTATVSVRRDHQAMHDGLTGLPNRKMLMLQHRGGARRGAARASGSACSCSTSTGSRRSTTPSGTRSATGCCSSSRTGSPTACGPATWWPGSAATSSRCCCPPIRDARAAREVAARLRAALTEPVRLEGMTFDLDASVGIALYPDHAPDFELLLQRADVAMYLAKEGRTGVEIYSPTRTATSPSGSACSATCAGPSTAASCELHYQPKVDLADGQVRGHGGAAALAASGARA